MTSSLPPLLAWLAAYDPNALYTEDDVETKFVLPLFRLLGYPEQNRRGKYPVVLTTGSRGRKHEIDQVYFSTTDGDAQKAGNVLVIVEAKRTSDEDLEGAIAQGQSYSEQLHPVLLVVSNGVRLMILRRKRFDPDEIVLDKDIKTLAEPRAAQELVTLLSYEHVLALHQRLINEPAYERFVRLEQALRAHPDIQEILAQGDFLAIEERDGRLLRIARPKVQIEGELPLCLSGGSCEITFSHILRRGLRIHLSHADILGTLMAGIEAEPDWDTRHFIERETEEVYQVQIGDIETQLSAEEARDLCACVDRFAGAYRDAIMSAEDALESWEFPLTSWNGEPAFYLTSVKFPFWKRLRKFAEQHEWQRGEIDRGWRIFERWAPGIRVGHESGDHAWLPTINRLDGILPLEKGLQHLVYVLPYGLPPPNVRKMFQDEDWKLRLGAQGAWTVRFAYQWLTSKFLPEVERRNKFWAIGVSFGQFRQVVHDLPYPPPEPIANTKQLAPYIYHIQFWLAYHSLRLIPSMLVVAPYEHLLDLARGAREEDICQHYVLSNMIKITNDLEVEAAEVQTPAEQVCDYFARGELIRDHLRQTPTVSPRMLNYVMRSFFGLYEHAEIRASQSALNRTWTALRPLWRLAQFEQRHVWPHREGRGR